MYQGKTRYLTLALHHVYGDDLLPYLMVQVPRRFNPTLLA